MGRLLATGLLVIAALVAVLAVNGTGRDKPEAPEARVPARESTQVAQAGAGSREAGAPADPRAPVGATVRMRGLRFRPDAVSVDVGQAVRFVNDDNVAHTVLEDYGPRSGETAAVDSRRIAPGETYRFVPRSAGLIAYVCTLHPAVMAGQILVERPAT